MSDPSEQSDVEELTLMVRELARGKGDSSVTLLPYLLRELKAIAQGHLRTQRPGHTLQASALVNEAYLKLFDRGGLEVSDRVHFFALAAKAMRQVLVDHARKRKSDKRGGDAQPVSLSIPAAQAVGGVDLEVLDLHLALEELFAVDERQGRIVELRYFGGLEETEVAELLGLSRTTVQREWRMARLWLGVRLRKGHEE